MVQIITDIHQYVLQIEYQEQLVVPSTNEMVTVCKARTQDIARRPIISGSSTHSTQSQIQWRNPISKIGRLYFDSRGLACQVMFV